MVDSDVDLVNDAAQSRRTLQICVQLAWVYRRMELHKDAYGLTSRIVQQLHLDDKDPTRELRELYRVFAVVANQEDSGRALQIFEAIARLDERTLTAHDPTRLQNLRSLGTARLNNEKIKEAVDLLQVVVKLYKELEQDRKALVEAQHDLARALLRDDQSRKALDLLLEVTKSQELLGEAESPDRLNLRSSLGIAYLKNRRFGPSIREWSKVAQIQAETLGDDHPKTRSSMSYLAQAQMEDNKTRARTLSLHRAETDPSDNHTGTCHDGTHRVLSRKSLNEPYPIRIRSLSLEIPKTSARDEHMHRIQSQSFPNEEYATSNRPLSLDFPKSSPRDEHIKERERLEFIGRVRSGMLRQTSGSTIGRESQT